MNTSAKPPPFYIGWDVGGWNCDKNGKSRDAIVILNEALAIVGEPWRGNLRGSINASVTTRDWISTLFSLCCAETPASVFITLAIDTPLGFSAEFLSLATSLKATDSVGDRLSNPYLYRQTERRLFKGKRGPLSAIKDMIGSQATKGMHVLAKFASNVVCCGVWTDGESLRVIETYPTACRNTTAVKTLLRRRKSLGNDDLDDARVCALIAYLFGTQHSTLEEPPKDVPPREGWIWIPKEVNT